MPVLRLFGAPTVELGGASIALPFERRTQLAAWLALRGGWVNREEAAALLWSDQTPRLAFANLRKTLFRLSDLPWSSGVEQQGSALRWAGGTDVGAFETALRDDRAPDALALVRGELLAGFDDDASEAWTGWLRFERDRLRAAWRAAALGVLDEDCDPATGLVLAGRLLEADPLDEAALCAQVTLLAASGQHARARQAWREFVERLHSELGIEPGTELMSLRDALAAEAACGLPTPPLSLVRTEAPAGDGFIGRAAELRVIAELLGHRQVRLLTIAGPGGIGKTRLMRRALHDLADAYADGAHFVALEDANDADTLLARVAQATGTALRGSASALDHVRTALADRQVLLGLDNFEQLADAGVTVLEPLLAAAPRLVLLVTSRARLGLASEQLLPLDGLPCPEAEDDDRVEAFDAACLFVAAAHRVAPALQPQAEARAIADICRQLDGLPLALELAAAWTRVLTCGEIATELREGMALLRDDSGTRPPRHASIAQVFAQSWQRLAPVEREALALLSVFQGGFTAEAARAVAGAPLPVLGALIDKSLMRKQDRRLTLHPLVQQFAAARLDPTALAQARRAHADWFHRVLADLAPAAAAGARTALQVIEDELENCRQAWRHAVVHGEAAAVRSTGQVLLRLLVRGRYEEALAMLRQAIDAPLLHTDRALQAWLRAYTAHCLGRLDRHAEVLADARYALAEPGADAATQLRAHAAIGHTALRQGQPAQALERFKQAFAIAEANGEPTEAAAALSQQAMAHQDLGRDEVALGLLHDALVRYRTLGYAEGTAVVLTSLGALYHARGEAESAEPYLIEAIALCEREGLTGPLQYALGNLSEIDLLLGRLEAGREHAARMAELARAHGRRLLAMTALAVGARFTLRLGEIEAGRAALVEVARAAIVMADTPIAWVNTLIVLADLLCAQGETRAADRLLGFVAGHPALDPGPRSVILVERRRAGLPEQSTLDWPGLTPDELLQRIVTEAPLAHAPLVALLRA